MTKLKALHYWAQEIWAKLDGVLDVAIAALPLPAGAATAANQVLIIDELEVINSLVPDVYDYISLAYTGVNLTTVVFRDGGAGGVVVSTLTLAYTGAQLDTVTKT